MQSKERPDQDFKKLDYSSAMERPTGSFEKSLNEDRDVGPFKTVNSRINRKLPSILVRNPESKFPTHFLLDSGSEITINKVNTLPTNARSNSGRRIALKGISPAPIKT